MLKSESSQQQIYMRKIVHEILLELIAILGSDSLITALNFIRSKKYTCADQDM